MLVKKNFCKKTGQNGNRTCFGKCSEPTLCEERNSGITCFGKRCNFPRHNKEMHGLFNIGNNMFVTWWWKQTTLRKNENVQFLAAGLVPCLAHITKTASVCGPQFYDVPGHVGCLFDHVGIIQQVYSQMEPFLVCSESGFLN